MIVSFDGFVFVVHLLSHARLLATPWTAACQASLFFTISQSLFKLISIEPVMQSNHLILGHSLFLLPSIFPSIRVFSNELALHIRWPKYWSFSISPSNEYSGLIYFKIDWVDLLEVQGTLKSLLQHHNSFIQLTFIFPCRGLNPVHGAYSSHMKDPIFHLFHLSVLLTPVNAISPHTGEKEKVPYVIHVGIQEADCAYDHKFLLSLEPNGPQRRSTST